MPVIFRCQVSAPADSTWKGLLLCPAKNRPPKRLKCLKLRGRRPEAPPLVALEKGLAPLFKHCGGGPFQLYLIRLTWKTGVSHL